MGLYVIPDDEDLVSFVEGLALPEGSWVSAVGTLSDAVLSVPSADAGDVSREFPGAQALVGFGGPGQGPFMATLASVGGVAGGRVVRGRAKGVTLVVQESSPGSAGKQPAARGTPLRPSTPADDDEADEAPRFGDRVDHFVFGLCDVMVVRGERMKIRDAGGGKLREIHLGAVKVLKPVDQDGRRVFKLARRGG